jgi:uncharacterized protein (TIRG00374 family)
MSSRIKSILQYVIIFGVTIFLIWFSLDQLKAEEGQDKWSYLLATWNKASKGWLMLMALVAIVSHIIRAERWRMLMVPTGHNTKLSYSFLSLMIGYLVNLAVPRGGEVSRCYNLYKLDGTPAEISFGTVVVERMVDLICLLVLIVIAFIVEREKLFAFIDTLPWNAPGASSKINMLLYLFIAVIVIVAIFYGLIKKNQRFKNFISKTWIGFKEGLLSVFRLKNKGLFIFYSILIWVLYFIMSYTVILAFPQTQYLGINAVLSLFAIGSIAMAAPLPGGAGSYHVLVPQGLVFLYMIKKSDAVAFTFIFHGWQTAIMIICGAISLIISSMIMKANASKNSSSIG